MSMYAYSQYIMPADLIYDESTLKSIGKNRLERCHIYMIGNMPVTGINSIYEDGGCMVVDMYVEGRSYDLLFQIPSHLKFEQEAGLSYLVDDAGERYFPNDDQLMLALHQESGGLDFDVLYIGQSFGGDGSRHALERLRKHETLQKISLTGREDGRKLNVLLIEVESNTRIVTHMNPFAARRDDGDLRIKKGIEKLFNTSLRERIALYEASMIRYFQPRFNRIFRDSFPSTNLRVLEDCYEKDFAGVISEFCFDDIPFRLRSDEREARDYHIARFDLHKSEDRKFFFSKEG